MEIVQKPELFYRLDEKKIDFAIYNWFDDPENDGYLPIKLDIDTNKGKISKKFYINSLGVKLINDPKKDRQLFSSGGVAYFSNRSISIRLLNEWLENIKRYPKAPDDQLLDYTFNYTTGVKKDLNVEWLTKSYCRVHWWIFDRPVINHPSNLSHREDDNFFKITGKQRFKIENIIFNGDDYEIIFTSHKKNRSLINKYAKSKKLKIQRIGKILKKHQDSCILKGNKKLRINKNLGYTHQF